jgi:hypothetical protein
MKGGNSEIFYDIEGSATLKNTKVKNYNPAGTIQKSLNLKDIYPSVVEVVHKFGRVHHEVDYSGYKENVLILKKGVKIKDEPYNYGMELVNMTLKDVKIEADFKKTQKTIKGKW